jgi:hypothetical protein
MHQLPYHYIFLREDRKRNLAIHEKTKFVQVKENAGQVAIENTLYNELDCTETIRNCVLCGLIRNAIGLQRNCHEQKKRDQRMLHPILLYRERKTFQMETPFSSPAYCY